MSIQEHPAQAPDKARPDNRLVLMDQAFYAGHHAAGQREVMQVGWVYQHPVDLEALQRFRDKLSQGMMGRLIERSPLPFGRWRWVTDPKPAELDIATTPRPRDELGDWFDERTQLPIDPESGPGWRISVVPLGDGSTAISLVLSHYVIDGIGAAVAVTQALLGLPVDLGYPPPRSRSRLQALVQDIRETAKDAPDVGRAVLAGAREARRRQQDVVHSQAQASLPVATPTRGADDIVIVPNIWIRLRLDDWNARAEALGGTASALAAAFTARLDRHMGRRHGDADDVRMLLTVNTRTMDDARAVAVSFVRVGIDPTDAASDLTAARTAIKQALKDAKDTPDESAELVALTPFTPKRAWKHLMDYAVSDPEQPAVCSNLGDTGPAASRPDGTLCDGMFARGASQNVTRGWLERTGSQLHVFVGTSMEMNQVGVCVRGYQPGSVTTRAELRELAERTLTEFGLTGEID
ncbi:hypothetical protein FHT40_006616 [Mycolicibacterium sp. BK556]|uniref:hypothetical protein n=1 Tax=Mycobacteriaceae TaxID=1762 RepID=UPI0010DC40F8|nr:hypothetical protein [Mycobacterium sp. BK086]MBB3606920.1 hypothetical protein [Mycolicibacterium sp. BK556]MBB3636677.1 hypothetical protein [Mycolicibacterium sp. BK607]TDO09212.1 hypothetical protein EV580_5248 [Mycobacterium sp. BK086]